MMSVINIIILIILALVILWVVLNNTIFKTNILYDQMCDATKTATISEEASVDNIILNKNIPGTNSSNFMLSVWFYIDNWNNNISKESLDRAKEAFLATDTEHSGLVSIYKTPLTMLFG